MSNHKKLSTIAKITLTLSITLGGIEPFCSWDITWQTHFDHGSRTLHILRSQIAPHDNLAIPAALVAL